MKNTLLFSFEPYEYIAQSLLELPFFTRGEFKLKRFPNEELHLALQTSVHQQACFVLGSISPPDTNLFSFMLLCHTLKKEHASHVTALLPYLAYSRHDKNESQKSYATALVAELLYRSGVDELITFDIHSQKTLALFSMPVTSLSPASLFAQEISLRHLEQAVIVAPDEGAIERCKQVAQAAQIKHPICYLEKHRTEEGISHTHLHGKVSERVIIIDDMLDTGGTLISCCKNLLRAGAKEIEIMVTHGLFTGDKWTELWKLGVHKIYCTDTIPQPAHLNDQGIAQLSTIPLLKHFLEVTDEKAKQS